MPISNEIFSQLPNFAKSADVFKLSDIELDNILNLGDTLDDYVNTLGDSYQRSYRKNEFSNDLSIVFLGSAGNRYGAIHSECGGIWINLAGISFLLDPGPSLISLIAQYNNSNANNSILLTFDILDAILCSHIHQDHSSNLITAIEGMTFGMKAKRGRVIGNPTTILGFDALDNYYFKNTTPIILHPLGSQFFERYSEFDDKYGCYSSTTIDRVKLIATPTLHHEKNQYFDTGIGFYLQGPNVDIWYTGDTVLFPGLLDFIESLSKNERQLIIIANAGGAHKQVKTMQLQTGDVEKICATLKPIYLLIQHYDLAYTSPQFRVGQANAVQRNINKIEFIPTSVIPTCNGLTFNWKEKLGGWVEFVLKDPISEFLFQYIIGLQESRDET